MMIESSNNSHAKQPRDDRSAERGMALLIVLWIVASAALVVSSLSATVRSGVSFVTSEVQLAKTEALLDAGVEIAATRLIDEDEARAWLPDGTRHPVSFAGSELAITIKDPNGLIDLNKANADLLLGFFRQFTGSDAKALQLRDGIMRARGPNTGEQETISGADAKPPTGPRLAFLDIGQLRNLEGVTLGLYGQVAPFITVYSRDGRINPTTAPNEVLSSIPKVTMTDITSLRRASQTSHEQDAALSEIMQRAGAYITDKPGPAHIVSVELRKRGDHYATRQVFVIATGLDANAPYRLIAKRPIVSVRSSRYW